MQTMPGDAGLRALLARVEAAEGPDRSIDNALWYQFAAEQGTAWTRHVVHQPLLGGGVHRSVPSYTDNLDAVLVLIEQCLPEVNCHGYDRDPFGFTAYVSRNHTAEPRWIYEAESGVSAALALVAALLRALVARGDRDGAAGGEGTGDG